MTLPMPLANEDDTVFCDEELSFSNWAVELLAANSELPEDPNAECATPLDVVASELLASRQYPSTLTTGFVGLALAWHRLEPAQKSA